MSRPLIAVWLLCALAITTGCGTQRAGKLRATSKTSQKPAQSRLEVPLHGIIVYSKMVSDEDYTADGGRYDLYAMSVPDGKVTRLTDHQSNPNLNLGGAIRGPLFSPDGRKIAFLADYSTSDARRHTMTGASPNEDAFLNVWVIDLRTHKVKPLTHGDTGWIGVGWSPDGRYIEALHRSDFEGLDAGPAVTLTAYAINIESGKMRKLKDDEVFGRPHGDGAFSPSHSRLAFVRRNKVYIAGPKGTGAKPIMSAESGSEDLLLAWSPDSQRLAVANLEPGVRIYDVPTDRTRTLPTIAGGHVTRLDWSHDGQLLVCTLHGILPDIPASDVYQAYGGDGVTAVRVKDGKSVTLKRADEDTKGIDWFEQP